MTIAIIAGIILVLGLVVTPFVLYARASGMNHAVLRASELEHPRDLLEG